MQQRWIAFLRIVVGLFFVGQGINKLDWYPSSEFLKTSLDRYAQNAPPLTVWYQNHVAYPGIEVWTRMIPTGEMLIGIALVLGLLTLPTLIIALALVINYHLANGALFSNHLISDPFGLLLIANLIVLMTCNAGSTLALDASKKKKGAKSKP
ncbi:MAG TPA: DoxX family membrane protein [Bacteroidota bacterium]|nr:DoxX family membrane protein [Bacteroidota bacterium]